MLKSHFNLQKDETEEAESEEEPVTEANVEEEKMVIDISDERILKKSEVSIRLSWLGKTAEGDGWAENFFLLGLYAKYIYNTFLEDNLLSWIVIWTFDDEAK